eukprot:SAG31_NODE_178_length_21247_cov_11.492009_4_plen_89_part_00
MLGAVLGVGRGRASSVCGGRAEGASSAANASRRRDVCDARGLALIGGVENIRKHRQAWFESRFKFAGADGRNLLFLIYYVLYLVLYKC